MGRVHERLATGTLGVLMLFAGTAMGGGVLLESGVDSAPAKSKQAQAAPKKATPAKSAPAKRAPSRQAAPSRQSKPAPRATPSRSQPTRSSPSSSRPSRSQPAKTQPAQTSPARTKPARTQPARTQPARTQPSRTQPAKTQPSRKQPTKSQPSKTQPTRVQPQPTRPKQVQPTRPEPSRVEPSRPQPSNVRPSQPRPAEVQPSRVQPRPSDGVKDGGQPGTNPGTGPSGVNRGPDRGVVRRAVSGGQVVPSERKRGTPEGFAIDRVRDSYVDRMRGTGKTGVGGRMQGHPDESDGHHDDGHHDDHHGGHSGDNHHGDDWHVDIDINIWTHPSYCPSGWWYVYGDYNNDGYTDYVCTNGSYSVYWYGWSGAYWDCSPWYGWYSSRYSYRWWSYSVPDRYRGVVYGVDAELVDEPGPMPATVQDVLPEAVPLSAVEVARLEMSLEAYRAHLSEYPDDWLALRELGLAMIRSGQRGDGVAMVSYAYSQDPLLAYDVVPVELFEGDAHELRDAVVSVVGWGHRNPSASAWLTVAVLMQAEGRDGPAIKMIDRAAEYGLDGAIADQMRGALVKR